MSPDRPDPERIDLRAPLPGDATLARLTFKAVFPGPGSGERTVKRSVATHADLSLTYADRSVETVRLDRAGFEDFLQEAARLGRGG